MNKSKTIYFLLTFSIVLIISGCFSSFLLSLRADHELVLRRMDDVAVEFETFSTNTTAFEEFRDNLYEEVLGNVYYETMYDTDSEVKNQLSNYEHLVDELGKNAEKMNNLCSNVYYPDASANNKCTNYKDIYEQVVNYFLTDIKIYNNNVKKYNEYQENINTGLLVDEYKTDKKYIDYNGDSQFDGKE